MQGGHEAIFNLGLRSIEAERFGEAEIAFRQIVEIRPGDSAGWGNLALCLKEQRKYQAAINAYQNLARLQPGANIITVISISECELGLGNLEKAKALIDIALKDTPNMAEVWIVAAGYFLRIEDFAKSLECSDKAIQINPGLAVAHLNRGWALLAMKELEKAILSTLEALRLDNNSLQAHINLAAAYLQAGRYDEAIEESLNVLLRQPDCIDARVNLAKSHTEKGNPQEALIILRGSSVRNSHTRLAESQAFNDIGAIDEAIKCLEESRSSVDNTTRPEILHSLGALLLKQGKLDPGWKLFEYRKKPQISVLANLAGTIPHMARSMAESKRRILILKEQGIGDNILFASLIIEVLNEEVELFLEADSRLHEVFRRSFGKNIHLIEKHSEVSQIRFDDHLAICSLGGIYRPTKEAFRHQAVGYLRTDTEKTMLARERIADLSDGRRIIGISWFSAGAKRQNRKKNIELMELISAIPRHEECLFINLQYRWEVANEIDSSYIRQMENIYTPAIDLCNDIDGIASYVEACDCIISISTSLAHLSCSLGQETHILLPLSAIWHWGSRPDRTDWYPTARLYRQSQLDDWEHPLAILNQALERSK